MPALFSSLAGVLLFAAALRAAEESAPLPRPESWTLAGPLGPVPERKSDALPLSDQENRGGWKPYDPMADEFEGGALDESRWWPRNPTWAGRRPALFQPHNVEVRDGKLRLAMRKEEVEGMSREKGYHTWTSAAVQSKRTVKYGYFEVKARPMRSHGSSAFWFYKSTKKIWTEIDVFEIGGGAPGFERKYHMNLHVFHTPEDARHWSAPGVWESAEPLADGYRVYGLEWDREKVRFYVDGVLVRWVENSHWRQPLTLNFDSETMPQWFGLPRDEDLPSTFSIEYVRAWKKAYVRDFAEIRGALMDRVRDVFGKDEGLLLHTLEVHGHAARILEREGGDPLVVHAAALLHDIGIPRAREVHGSSAGKFQEIEGPPIAERILAALGVQEEAVDLIAGIVANHHSAKDEDIAGTPEFRIVWDADWLVNFPGAHRNASKEEVARKIGEIFRTRAGREAAQSLFVSGDSH